MSAGGRGEFGLDAEPLRKLEELGRNLGEDLLGEVVAIFRDKVPAQVRDLRAAVTRGDGEQIEGLAHSIKGSAGNLGARRLLEVASALETRGRSGDAPAAAHLLPALELATEAAVRDLDAWVREARGGEGAQPGASSPPSRRGLPGHRR